LTSTDRRSDAAAPDHAFSRAEQPAPLYRQGDVLLVAVPGIPKDALRQRRKGRLVLAEGEATGHAHAIAERDAREFRVGEERFVLVRSAAQLVHEEHATIDLPRGAYRVIIQREYEPAPIGSPAWRRVVD
jgi:hypothetical protein